MFYTKLHSPVGDIFIIWEHIREKTVVKRIFINTILKSDFILKENQEIIILKEKIKSYFNGKDVKFSLTLLDFNGITDFEKKVYQEVFKIPKGILKSYKDIAIGVGSPKSARAVGNALKKNRFPIIIPCHRVIRSDGKLGGFQPGVKYKKILIDFERIT